MVNKTGIFLLCSLFCLGKRDPLPNVCDGPYISYKGDKVFVRSIDAANRPVIDSFYEKDKLNKNISVHFSGHADWDFTAPLKTKIENEPCVWKKPG